MLTTEKNKRICRKYSTPDKDGLVHCRDCPLVISRRDRTCRAFMHWDRHRMEWGMDEPAESKCEIFNI